MSSVVFIMAHRRSTVYCMYREVTVLTLIGRELSLPLPSWVIWVRKMKFSFHFKWEKNVTDPVTRRRVYRTCCLSMQQQVPCCSFCIVCNYVFVCARIPVPSFIFCEKEIRVVHADCCSLSPLMRMLFRQTTGSHVEVSLKEPHWGTGAWGEFIVTGLSLNSFPPLMNPAVTGKILHKSAPC